jgi:hypothetical protein
VKCFNKEKDLSYSNSCIFGELTLKITIMKTNLFPHKLMKPSCTIAAIALGLLALTAGCERYGGGGVISGSDAIVLSVVNRDGVDLLDLKSEPHYTFYQMKAYYLDEKGKKHEFAYRFIPPAYYLSESYNRYVIRVDLHASQANSGKSTVILEWDAAEKPDTLVTVWANQYPSLWQELYLNGELLETCHSDESIHEYAEYVKDK